MLINSFYFFWGLLGIGLGIIFIGGSRELMKKCAKSINSHPDKTDIIIGRVIFTLLGAASIIGGLKAVYTSITSFSG